MTSIEQHAAVIKEKDKKKQNYMRMAESLFGGYISLVQSAAYTSSMRAAIFWSAIPLFYIIGGLEVKASGDSSFWGVSISGITHEKVLKFLLVMHLYYTVRFSFWIVKIWRAHSPIFVFFQLFNQWKHSRGKNHGPEYTMYKVISDLKLWAGILPHSPGGENLSEKSESGSTVNEIRNFLLLHPIIGFLDNFVGRMLLPGALCAFAFVILITTI